MNYYKFLLVLFCLTYSSCSYKIFVKKDKVISSSNAYIIKLDDQIIFVPVQIHVQNISPEILSNQIGYRIYRGCDLDFVIETGKSFTVDEQFNGYGKIFREQKKMIISKCIVNFIELTKKDLWDKAEIKLEFKNKEISFVSYAEFKGEIINIISRN